MQRHYVTSIIFLYILFAEIGVGHVTALATPRSATQRAAPFAFSTNRVPVHLNGNIVLNSYNPRLQNNIPLAFKKKHVLTKVLAWLVVVVVVVSLLLPSVSQASVLSDRFLTSWSWSKVIKYRLLPLIVAIRAYKWIQVRRRQSSDATSEWGRYARYPGARGRALLSLLCMQLFPVWLAAKILPIPKPHKSEIQKHAGLIFANGLLKVGPLYIKLGQILSSRPNLLPEEWSKPMERLQDKVPARRGQAALELAEASWSSSSAATSFNATFLDFDTEPLAAASLGQVHRAVLRSNNDTVAIKIQRPFLRQIYDQDLALFTKVASAVDNFLNKTGKAGVGGVSQSWTEIFEDAEVILYREIDYNIEADNGVRFNRDFGLDKGGKPIDSNATSRDGKQLPSAAPWLRAPHVYKNLSSEKVLVMEFVPSIKVTNKEKLDEAGVSQVDREYLADCLGRAYLRQFCCNLFFSTDPHPGNLGVELLNSNAIDPKDRVRLVFYDFGQAATLTPNQAEGILEIIEAIVDSDVERSVQSFQTMGVLKENADLDKVRAKVTDNFRTGKVKANKRRLSKRGYKFRLTNSTQSVRTTNSTVNSTTDSEVMTFFQLPAEYAFVGRALSQMDGVGKSLDPEFDFVSAAAPWIYEIKGAEKYLVEEAKKWVANVCKKIRSVF